MSTTGPASPQTTPKPALPSDPAELERQIALRQAHLAATVDELTTRLTPKDMARRSAAGVQARVDSAVRAEDGSLRVERLAALGVAVAAVLGLLVWRRTRR
ncbi:MAG: DUF3618 domain-containing protein [Actinomycetes bacterium]